ncbi:MAG: hypothetical protein NTY93_00040 [Candidatus Kaiserbacteria bacterium]|nr:hypothetical protein [Candidatus Kaiserbacteria bacterium]
MPNGHSKKEYGKHEYPNQEGTSDCRFDCGCWAGPARSGGPLGLDPFGACPGNPKDGQLLGGKDDYENVVTYRILDLESRVYEAEELLKKVSPSKIKLAETLDREQGKLIKQTLLLREIRRLIETDG